MASAFTHSFVGLAFSNLYAGKRMPLRFWFLTLACPAIPDLDVIGFRFGIAYGDFWGHRGFTHSLLFAVLFGLVVTLLFFPRRFFSANGLLLSLYFGIITATHAVLDAMTTGGLGVAFLSPFNDTRYFFPWRPIRVSPIDPSAFFNERGWAILSNEIYWVWVPCLFLSLIFWLLSRMRRQNQQTVPLLRKD